MGDGHQFSPDHQESRYYTKTYRKGVETAQEREIQYQFYDGFGRIIRQLSFGLNEEPVFIDNFYDNKGRLMKVTEPYFQSEETQLNTRYYYDDFGRTYRSDLPTGNVILQLYEGRTTRTMNMGTGVLTSTTIDASGRTESIKDPHGEIEYRYYSSGQLKSVDALGARTVKYYDDAGRDIRIEEPNSGTTSFIYNPFGELIYQEDSRGNTYEMTYDDFGRILQKKLLNTGEKTTYDYINEFPQMGNAGFGFGQVRNIVADNGYAYRFEYDELSRLISKTEVHPPEERQIFAYTAWMSYDDDIGYLSQYTYPSGYQIGYQYSNNGLLNHVFDKETQRSLWKLTSTNARGQILEYINGNGLRTSKTYSPEGFLTAIETGHVQDLEYAYNPLTGNLITRTDNLFDLTETFSYDAETHSRLMTWGLENGTRFYSKYAQNGNILFKYGVTSDDVEEGMGSFQYAEDAGPHALTSITSPAQTYEEFAAHPEYIRYTAFNKLASIRRIERGITYDLEIDYGPDHQRKASRSYTEINNVRRLKQTKHFVMGNYEVEIGADGGERRLHYLISGDGIFAIREEKNKEVNNYYIHKNFQGSIYSISDGKGDLVTHNGIEQVYSFDPWGRRRNHKDWSFENVPEDFLFDRGYTGHEHLKEFDLINMNGRVYDPWVSRFLSPDPFVQSPANSQSYNRYAYAFNNPLKFVDLSGYSNKRLGILRAEEENADLQVRLLQFYRVVKSIFGNFHI